LTSHYLGCVAKGSFETVFEALSRAFGNVYSKKFDRAKQSLIGIILGEQFFFRVSSDVAILIILKQLSPDKTKIEVISCAGGKGLLSISYAAHSAYVHDIKNFLVRSGLRIESVKEIPYFSGQPESVSHE